MSVVNLRMRPTRVDWRTLDQCRPNNGDAVLVRYTGRRGLTEYLTGVWQEGVNAYATDGTIAVSANVITGWTLI